MIGAGAGTLHELAIARGEQPRFACLRGTIGWSDRLVAVLAAGAYPDIRRTTPIDVRDGAAGASEEWLAGRVYLEMRRLESTGDDEVKGLNWRTQGVDRMMVSRGP